MESLDDAAKRHDWTACRLALVAALEELPAQRALEVATRLVVESTPTPGRPGRWMQFIERAHETLERAPGIPMPDYVVALGSAVADTVAAHGFLARLPRPLDQPADQGEMAAAGGGTTVLSSAAALPDTGVAATRDAWLRVAAALRRLPELRDSIGRGEYREGPSHARAVWAAGVGIL